MLLKLGGGAGGSIEISNAPKITFNGRWLGWHLEFYSGILYWECWIFSSGVLTLQEAYTLDAWGIGGGGARDREDNGNGRGASGTPNMAESLACAAGTIAVTIGAGGKATSSSNSNGGTTSLGKLLSCPGGSAYFSSQVDTRKRNRFYDETRDEHGRGGQSGNGWLDFVPPMNENYGGREPGHGLGAGGLTFGTGGARGVQGALVIRIPVE